MASSTYWQPMCHCAALIGQSVCFPCSHTWLCKCSTVSSSARNLSFACHIPPSVFLRAVFLGLSGAATFFVMLTSSMLAADIPWSLRKLVDRELTSVLDQSTTGEHTRFASQHCSHNPYNVLGVSQKPGLKTWKSDSICAKQGIRNRVGGTKARKAMLNVETQPAMLCH